MKLYDKWTYEATYDEAKKYKTRSEFKRNKVWAYQSARVNGWLDDYTWMPKPVEPYTIEDCIEIAKTCKTKSEYSKKCQACYKKTKENGVFDTFTWFKNPSLEKQDLTKKEYWIYGYFDYDNKYVYIGLTKNKYRHKQHLSAKKKNARDSANDYFLSIGKQLPEPVIIENNLNGEEAQIKEKEYLEKYRNEGWKIINIAKPGSLGSAGFKWDRESIIEEASKYKTLKEFMNNAYICYQRSKIMDILKDLTWLERERHFWTYDECYNIAKKYIKLKDFQKNDKPVYSAALRNKWIHDYTWLEVTNGEYEYVTQISKDGKILNIFTSVKDASDFLNISMGRIYYSCANSTLIRGTDFYFKGRKISKK